MKNLETLKGKGNVRKPVLAVEVEETTSSARERELELMKEIDKLKKRIREIEIPFEERKTFQSVYFRNQREKLSVFCAGKEGI